MKLFNLFSSNMASTSRRSVLLAGLRRAAVTLALALLVLPAAQSQAQAPLKPDVPLDELMKTGELPDNVMGQDDAPYTIIEYSSMTCPHCAQFHKEILPELKTKYIETGKAKYIVREYPLDNVAAAAFMLARCVDQSKYFDLVDLLYINQEEWAFSGSPLAELKKFAKQAGFTDEKFDRCVTDKKLLSHIEWVRNRAYTDFEVRGTPTFFVNGQRFKGGTIEDFDKLLGGADGKS
jgi:protein-disulfide isomerase